MSFRILMIGIRPGGENVRFEEEASEAPSLFDYDIVIADIDTVLPSTWRHTIEIDEHALVKESDIRGFEKTIDSLSREAQLLVEKGGLLVCILRPIRGVKYEYWYQEKRTVYLDNYSWIPIKYFSTRVTSGAGTQKIVADDAGTFGQYLRMDETHWIAYLDNLKGLDAECRVLAANDAGKAIAAQFSVGEGSLVFLPDSEHPKQGNILVECAVSALKGTFPRPAPAWLQDIKVPGEDADLQHLKALAHQLSELQQAHERAYKDLEEKRSVKRILYEKDEPLEDAIKKTFEELGFTLTRKGDKDWIAGSDVGEAILEVTGSDSSIDIDKLRQLLNYLIDDYKESGVEKKAILIGNHFANLAPEARGEPFTEKVLEESKVHSICLVSTLDLFKMVCNLRERKANAPDIRKELIQGVGLCRLT